MLVVVSAKVPVKPTVLPPEKVILFTVVAEPKTIDTGEAELIVTSSDTEVGYVPPDDDQLAAKFQAVLDAPVHVYDIADMLVTCNAKMIDNIIFVFIKYKFKLLI